MSKFIPDTGKRRSNVTSKLRGVFIGIVTANKEGGDDPKYQVRVRFPWLPGDSTSYLARVCTPMAGDQRGVYHLPEGPAGEGSGHSDGDQVLVVFEHGDVRRPLIVGGLWSEKQPPPERNRDQENNVRVIKSRSGHRIILDDTEGGERLIIVDSTRKNKVEIDTAKKTVTVQCAEGDVSIAAEGAVRLHGKTMALTASDSIEMSCDAEVDVQCGGKLSSKASGVNFLKCSSTAINPGSSASPAVPPASAAVDAAEETSSTRAAEDEAAAVEASERAPGIAGVAERTRDFVEQTMEQHAFIEPAVRAGIELAQGDIRGALEVGIRELGPEARRVLDQGKKVESLIHGVQELTDNPLALVANARTAVSLIDPENTELLEVLCTVDNVTDVAFEVINGDTGALIRRGTCMLDKELAKALVDVASPEVRQCASIAVRFIGDRLGKEFSSTTAPIPIGSSAPGPSPSTQLIDPSRPLPRAAAPDPLEPAGAGTTAAPSVDTSSGQVPETGTPPASVAATTPSVSAGAPPGDAGSAASSTAPAAAPPPDAGTTAPSSASTAAAGAGSSATDAPAVPAADSDADAAPEAKEASRAPRADVAFDAAEISTATDPERAARASGGAGEDSESVVRRQVGAARDAKGPEVALRGQVDQAASRASAGSGADDLESVVREGQRRTNDAQSTADELADGGVGEHLEGAAADAGRNLEPQTPRVPGAPREPDFRDPRAEVEGVVRDARDVPNAADEAVRDGRAAPDAAEEAVRQARRAPDAAKGAATGAATGAGAAALDSKVPGASEKLAEGEAVAREVREARGETERAGSDVAGAAEAADDAADDLEPDD